MPGPDRAPVGEDDLDRRGGCRPQGDRRVTTRRGQGLAVRRKRHGDNGARMRPARQLLAGCRIPRPTVRS